MLLWLSIECFSAASTFVGSRLPRRRSGRSTGTVVPRRLVVEQEHLERVVGDNPRRVRPDEGPLVGLRVVLLGRPGEVSA